MGDFVPNNQANVWSVPPGADGSPPAPRPSSPGRATVRWAVAFAALAVCSGGAVIVLSFLWILAAMAPPGMAEWLFPRARRAATYVVLPFCLLSVATACFGIRQIRRRHPCDRWRRQDRGLAIFAIVVSGLCALAVGSAYV